MPFDRMYFPHLCTCSSIHPIRDLFELSISEYHRPKEKPGKHFILILTCGSTNLLQSGTVLSKWVRDCDLNLSFRSFVLSVHGPSVTSPSLPLPIMEIPCATIALKIKKSKMWDKPGKRVFSPRSLLPLFSCHLPLPRLHSSWLPFTVYTSNP